MSKVAATGATNATEALTRIAALEELFKSLAMKVESSENLSPMLSSLKREHPTVSLTSKLQPDIGENRDVSEVKDIMVQLMKEKYEAMSERRSNSSRRRGKYDSGSDS